MLYKSFKTFYKKSVLTFQNTNTHTHTHISKNSTFEFSKLSVMLNLFLTQELKNVSSYFVLLLPTKPIGSDEYTCILTPKHLH